MSVEGISPPTPVYERVVVVSRYLRFADLKERGRRLLPERAVCERYGISRMSLWRWERDPALGFPKAIKIRNRNYRAESELDEFDARMRDSVSPPPGRKVGGGGP